MLANGLTTLQLVWRESAKLFHSRNPFPVGGVVEDSATGAAAAALGGYLRDSELVKAPFAFRIRQGEVMGRPSQLFVDVAAETGLVFSHFIGASGQHYFPEPLGPSSEVTVPGNTLKLSGLNKAKPSTLRTT